VPRRLSVDLKASVKGPPVPPSVRVLARMSGAPAQSCFCRTTSSQGRQGASTPSMSMRSKPWRVGNSASCTTRPLTRTRPARTHSAACVREPHPNFEMTRATPRRGAGDGDGDGGRDDLPVPSLAQVCRTGTRRRRGYHRRVSDELFVPKDFSVPDGLTAGELRLVPLGPQHNESDYAAWMSGIDHIRTTP